MIALIGSCIVVGFIMFDHVHYVEGMEAETGKEKNQ